MEKKGIILIAIIVLGLSLGPLTYFIQGGREIEPENVSKGEEQFQLSTSNFTGKVTEVEPYVFFEGYKQNNSVNQAKKEIQQIFPEVKNYSVQVDLASGGSNAWKYTIAIPTNTTTLSSKYGFKMAFLLASNYLNPVTYRKALVQMPPLINAKTNKKKEIQVMTGNETVKTNVIYSQGKGYVDVTCPKIISGNKGHLTNVLARCAQQSDTILPYGVTQKHFEIAGRTEKVEQSLEVQTIDAYEAKYNYEEAEGLSTSELADLPAEITINKESKTLVAKAESEEDFNETVKYFENRSLEQIGKDALIVTVDLPSSVTFNSTVYEVADSELDTKQVKILEESYDEEMDFEVWYRILYEHIFAVKVNYLPELN